LSSSLAEGYRNTCSCSAGARRALALPPKPEPRRVWHCHPDEIRCRHGHDYVRVRNDSQQLRFRVDGHMYLDCPQCTQRPGGHTYAFGVITTRPFLLITFYAVDDRAQFDALLAHPDDASTWDLLVFLGYAVERRRSPR
jgi:hypothetical protein